jgi:hypothetical protein
MDFQTRELRFGLNDQTKFSDLEVKRALRGQGFADAEILSGPSLPSH